MRFILILLTLVFASGPVMAQALTPMSGSVKTYTDLFALQLKAFNPYDSAQKFTIAVFNESGVAIDDIQITAPAMSLPPHETGSFYVWGDASAYERIVVCLTSAFFSTGAGAQLRGEVCGKYEIIRLGR